jgi:predicted dehydrogenase
VSDTILRRDWIAGAGAALTTSLFTRKMEGANDKITVGFIGLGAMGSGNLEYAIKAGAQAVTVCDVYKPHLDRAVASAAKYGQQVQATDDFRQILSDKSIDAVCISTPDHWHAYLMVEACKAGKDVYVEKPACVYVDEGKKMVAAARKYNRVVQGGTMQRSGGYFLKAAELVKAGAMGDVTFCHAYQCGTTKKEGWGNPPDSDPPSDLNWDMWLGPAPERPFNANRWGVKTTTFPTFRYFWDYAGGAMTDWGVHLIDPLHQCFGEVMPTAVTALGNKFYVEDNTETPDTMLATFYYPHFLTTYESRTCNPLPMFNMKDGGATVIHGTEASIFVNRRGCWLIPNKSTGVSQAWENNDEMKQMNVPHWKNFLACIKSREKPTSEIETTVRSSTVCLLGNLALRNQARLDWDETNWTVKQADVQPKLAENYRSPWKLEV